MFLILIIGNFINYSYSAVLINEDFSSGSLPSGWAWNSSYINTGTAHSETHKVGMNSSNDWIRTTQETNPGTLTFWIRTSSDPDNWVLTVQTSPDGSTWTDQNTVTENGSGGTITNTYTQISTTLNLLGNYYIRFYLTSRSLGSCYIDDVYLDDYSASPTPEIQLQEPINTDVICGYTYDFGTVTTNTNNDVTIRIKNTGTSDLTISSYPITGTNAGNFSVFTAPSSPVSSGSFTDMVIRFHPTSTGSKTAKITINNDDSDESTCEVNFTAVAQDPCSTPTAQPTSLDLTTNTTTTSIDGSYTTASPVADNYLVVYSTSNSLSSNPVDGTTYSPGNALGGGIVVDNISGTSFTASSLTSGTEYYFFIFANNNSSCTGGPNYNITNPLSGSEITIPENVSWNTAGCISNNSIDLTWDAATGNSTSYLLVVREGAIPHMVSSLDPNTQTYNTDYSACTASEQYGSTTPYSRVVYKGTGTSVTITGLTQGTSYTFKIHTYTIGSSNHVYSSGTQQTNTINLSDVLSASATGGNAEATVNWANPDATCFDEILVVANETAGIGFTPSGNGSAYTANTVYSAANQVVYKGAGTGETITNLTNGTTYYLEIFVRLGTQWSQGVEVSCIPNAAAVLEQGDIAVVGLCSNISTCISGTGGGDDEISFVCFQDITTNTEFDMTDNGWQRVNANLWGSSEGIVRVKRTGTPIAKGTIVTFRFHNGGTYECVYPDNNWTFTQQNAVGADLVLNSNGDQIYFMQGGNWVDGASNSSHDANYIGGNILFGFNTYSSWNDFINSTQRSGLISGMDCFNMVPSGATDYLKYTGPTTPASQIEWIGRLNDNTNWSGYADCTAYYAASPDYTNGDTLDIISTGIDVTYNWYGNKSTEWFDCANWGPLKIPTAANNVVIPNSTQVDTNIILIAGENAACKNLAVQDTIYTIKGENGSTKVLTVNGNLTLDGGSIDFDDDNDATTDGTIYVKGNWINNYDTDSFACGNSTVIFNGNTTQTITSNSGTENFGSVQITGSSVLNLNGNDILIANNWTNYNQSGLTEGTSIVTFNGTTNQNINTTGGEVFYDFVTDNAVSVTLLSNLIVSNQLNQSQGELILNGKTLILQNDLIRTSGTFTGTTSSNLTINGSGNLASHLYFTTGSENLGNFTVNRSSSGTVTIANDLAINGILAMTAGELDLNDKVLTLNGTVSGTGTLKGSASSSIVFGGSGALGTIYFSSGSQELEDLTTNRSSGNSILGTDLTVNNIITLTNGIISTGSNNLIATNTASGSVTEQSTLSYINGNLRRYVLSAGDYDFPIGTSANYELANITLNSSTGITYFDSKFTNPVGTTDISALGLIINGTAVTTLLDYGYWTITADAYTSVNYDATITSRGHTNGGASANQHTIVKRNNSSSNWAVFQSNHSNTTQSGTGTNPITAKLSGLTSFSDFAIARSNLNPLPITLISFNAKPNEKYIELNWATQSEINNDFFTIEKSYNAITFFKVLTINGNGTTNQINNYSAQDYELQEQTIYYRLKQTDYDGKYSYSNIIPVYLKLSNLDLVFYNNILSFKLDENLTNHICIVDALGRIYFNKNIENQTILTLDISNYRKGIYFVNIKNKQETITKKILVN